MSKEPKESTHPAITIRLHPDTLAALEARALKQNTSRAAMAEIALTAGLQALGETVPPVDVGSKEARKAVMDFKKRLGNAVEAALEELKPS